MGLRKRLKDAVEDKAMAPARVVCDLEWGLALPNGTVTWGSWGDNSFDGPLERLQMVARLQLTADEVGWGQDEFLSRYNWVTRTKIHAVAHEDGSSYSINAPEVSQQEVEQ